MYFCVFSANVASASALPVIASALDAMRPEALRLRPRDPAPCPKASWKNKELRDDHPNRKSQVRRRKSGQGLVAWIATAAPLIPEVIR